MPRLEPPTITSRNLFDRVSHFPGIIELGESEPSWYRFAHGYRLAADELVARLSKRGAGEAFICLPILFLYRHSVELYLKALLLDVGALQDEEEAIQGRHDLLPLWTAFRSELLAYDPSQDSPWLDRAGNLIGELNQLDGKSFSFRYPVAKDGSLLLTPGQGVHLQHFADVMKELYVVLEGASALFSEHLDMKFQAEEYDYHLYYN